MPISLDRSIMEEIKVKLVCDDTCRNNPLLKDKTSIHLSKLDIFTYGVMNMDVPPEKIGDNEFEYRESKIPSLESLYSDCIAFNSSKGQIVNKMKGECGKVVSELVGVGVGLRTFIDISKLTRRSINRIGVSKKQEKRLDFTASDGSQIYEVETKGTVYRKQVKPMIEHVHAKKAGKTAGPNRLGFITQIRKPNDKKPSLIHATDPEGYIRDTREKNYYDYLEYYLIYLSYILDNADYNTVVRRYLARRYARRPFIRTKRIPYQFTFNGIKYLGQCFDKRLIIEMIKPLSKRCRNLDQLFDLLTAKTGRTKFFLGIDEKLLQYFNYHFLDELEKYNMKEYLYEDEKSIYVQMSDGVLFLKSKDDSIGELSTMFTEEEVRLRLEAICSFLRGEPHECGGCCRSRDKKGKLCKIKTFRNHCYFHR